MHPSRHARRIHPIHGIFAFTALAAATLMPLSAHADDAPSPCTALKRIVAAAPTGFSQLTPEDGKGIAQP
jgi:hypothetical protein